MKDVAFVEPMFEGGLGDDRLIRHHSKVTWYDDGSQAWLPCLVARLLAALLATRDELSLTELAERAGLAYPTVHREVARLIDAGILVERQVGRTLS